VEFRRLSTLVSRAGRVQSRERLLADVWGAGEASEARTVDTHVKRLRQKLGREGELVETVRSVGYRFRDPAEGA
jgi:two-component system phosphate regulon response regulator PhoB